MVIKIVFIKCERCKKRTLKYAGTLCAGCYEHRYHHHTDCPSCKKYNFDYEKYLKKHPIRKKKVKKNV